MCGIVGITSNKEVTSSIINSLKKLEYRGYDSAGIATLNEGHINEIKCEGRVDALEKNYLKLIYMELLALGTLDGRHMERQVQLTLIHILQKTFRLCIMVL